MPIKRTAEELERPPLPRGSACHRCFTRKVRCSGQPDASTGLYGCSSCLRTARHRGHDPSQVRCAFEREGLCSEEGGPTMSGQVLTGAASTGPTRRQRPSVRGGNSSNTSIRSSVSTASSARTDSYSTDASSIAPSVHKTSPRLTGLAFPAELPSPPTFQHPASLPPLIVPTAVPLSSQNLAGSTTDLLPSSPELPTPRATDPKARQTLLNRRANAPHRQLSLSASTSPFSGSPYPGASPYVDEFRQQASAPLLPPSTWGQAEQYQPFDDYCLQRSVPQYYFDGPLPNTTFALDLAPFSALTPSTLARMNITPTSSYDFSSSNQPPPARMVEPPSFSPTGAAFVGSLAGSTLQPGDASFPSTLSNFAAGATEQASGHQSVLAYPSNYPLPLAPPAQYAHGVNPQCATSFYLPSPGITYSSSIPNQLRSDPTRHYFDGQQ
ncbi:uncharacterized protein JCM15063_001123 [Sporobolomyces koalae]|uniref:uncharacterized protein n=1 Tax=Sporobolomyces koalae TaxID=500713 RepID=UPI0031784B7A